MKKFIICALTLVLVNTKAFANDYSKKCLDLERACNLNTKALSKLIQICRERPIYNKHIVLHILFHSVFNSDVACLDKIKNTGLITNELATAYYYPYIPVWKSPLSNPESPKSTESYIKRFIVTNTRLSLMAHAAYRGDFQVMKKLLSMGAKANELYPKSTPVLTPVGAAALFGKVDVLNFLVQLQVPLNSPHGVSPLLLSIFSGHIATFDFLLNSNPQLEVKLGIELPSYESTGYLSLYNSNDTPINVAAQMAMRTSNDFYKYAVIRLASAGANLQAGNSFLYYESLALKPVVKELMKNLIQLGLDINAVSENGTIRLDRYYMDIDSLKIFVEEFHGNVNQVGTKPHNEYGVGLLALTQPSDTMKYLIKSGLNLKKRYPCKINHPGTIYHNKGPYFVCNKAFPKVTLLKLAIDYRDVFYEPGDWGKNIIYYRSNLEQIVKLLKQNSVKAE